MTLLSMYVFYWVMAAVGLTLGYHRTVAHGKYKLHPILESIVVYIGLVCSACSPLSWAGVHRMHHRYADTPLDPHSPKYQSAYQILFSTYRVKKIPRKFVKGLYKNPRVMFMHKYRWYILAVTYCIALLIHPMALLYLLALLPISFICYGLVNLFGHNDDGAVNVWWINIFAPFEGNHHDHHA